MADDILQRARNALNRSQQFRNRNEGPGIEKTQERIPIGEFQKENSIDFKSQRTGAGISTTAPEARVETRNRNRDNPTQSIRQQITDDKSDEDESTESSVTFTSDAMYSKGKPRGRGSAKLPKLRPATEQFNAELNDDKNVIPVKSSSKNVESVKTKTPSSGVSKSVSAGSSMISSEPSESESKSKPQSSRRSGNSTSGVKVRSFESPSTEKSELKMPSQKANKLINNVESSHEVLEHLKNIESPEITIATEPRSRKSTKSQVKFQEEIPEENTLSHISSLQMSVPQTEDEEEDSSLGKIESFTSSQNIPAMSVSVAISEVKSVSESVSESISERIESIINELTSVHKSIRSRSRTYSSSFVPDVSGSNRHEQVSEIYSSSFLPEDSFPQEIISDIPEYEREMSDTSQSKISDTPIKNISGHSVSSHDKISEHSKSNRKIKTSLKESKVSHETRTNRTHRKSKIPSERKSKKSNHKIEIDPEEISDVPDYLNYVPKTKHNIYPDPTRQVILNPVGDLPGFCTDLIRSVVDSNERMYNYTMDAAAGMTKMYHRHRRGRNRTKKSPEEPEAHV